MSALPAALVPPPAVSTVSARPCVLVNPRSFQASTNDLARRALALCARVGADAVPRRGRAHLAAEPERLRAAGQRRLFVLAGDGTVQGIVQYLATQHSPLWQPELLVLGGGRSNVTAHEFGHGSALRKLSEALRRTHKGAAITVQERQLLRLEARGLAPQHGFLFAAGVIDAGIRLCEQHRQSGTSWLHRGPLSSAYCLVKLTVQVNRGRSPLPPYPDLRIDTGTAAPFSGPQRLLVASTLLHRLGLFNPYAARGVGAVRLTAIRADAERFWRRLPRAMAGRFTDEMTPERGYLSGRFERVAIDGLTSFSLDGEMFDVDPSATVLIQGGPAVRMLQL